MFLKAVLIAFTCSGFILGFRIDDRAKGQAIGTFGEIAGGFAAKIPGIPSKLAVPNAFVPGKSAEVPSKPGTPGTTVPSDTEDVPTSTGSSDGSSDGSDASSTAEASDTSNSSSGQSSPGTLGTGFIPKIPGLPSIPKVPGLPSIPSIPSIPSGNSNIPSVPGIPSRLDPIKGISEGIGKGIGDGIVGAVKVFGSGITQIAGGVANRLQNAVNQTYQEEENSVKNSFDSVKGLIHQKIETGANLTKTGFDLGTVGPKFIKHLVIN